MLQPPAYAAATVKAPIAPFTIERRDPGRHDVLIDSLYCGVCHFDIHQADPRLALFSQWARVRADHLVKDKRWTI